MISSKRRKSDKALSGAITALILVIASVIIALIVVGYVFGLFGTFASSPNIHLVNAYISNGYLYVTVSNTGSANGQILGVVVEAGGTAISTTPTAGSVSGTVTVAAGGTTVLSVTLSASLKLSPGEQVTFYLVTNTGAQIAGTATVLS